MPDTTITIRPARNLNGSVRLPGDKSISHRYAMLAAIAEGTSKFENFSSALDCASTLKCVGALGCKVDINGSVVTIEGTSGTLTKPDSPLECGNSGSTMRMLSGILAGQDFESTLVGDESLSNRPMGRVIKPLREMGAAVTSAEGERPPLHIKGGALRSIHYKMPVASAQVKSCVLFAGLQADGTTTVEEPIRTRDHSELALRAFGAELTRTRTSVSLEGRQKLRAIEAFIPGDMSSAAFFLCAALLFPDSNLIIDNLLLNPTRAVLLDILTAMGGQVSFLRLEEQHGELTGTVQFRGGVLKGGVIEGANTVALIDEIPVLAAIAPYSAQGIDIRDARELRVKESDRIAACIHNLRAMGAVVEERDDGMRIPGGQRLNGAELQSFGDHRIAMAFAIAALRAAGDTTMHGADAASVSYPEFYSTLEAVLER